MKHISHIIYCLISLFFLNACQTEDDPANANVGYLRLDIGANTTSNTKAGEEEEIYNAKRLWVKILNAKGEDACEPFEYNADTETPEKKVITLPTGTYAIQASSYGFDGKTSAYDKPYYSGYAENIVVTKGEEVAAKVTCTLANVKVTVNFDQSFKDSFTSATANITSLTSGAADQLQFKMGGTQNVGYFPVVDLKAEIAVVNKSGESHSQTDKIEGVKARDHYIFNYKVAESGTGSINISIDEATRTYTYDLTVPTKAKLAITEANAWSTFAYLEGTVPASGTTIDPSKIEFQYKLPSEDDNAWKKVEGDMTTTTDGAYKITLKGLSPQTTYQCRIAYDNESSTSSTVDFTTENNTIPENLNFNLNFDEWCQNGGSWYACSEDNYASNKFWDSGNEGANTIDEINPTKKETEDVVKGFAARLTSTEVNAIIFNVFAAGSLYSGDFIESVVGGLKPEDSGAKLSFGQPYSDGRPTRLTGYYKYNPANVTKYTSSKIPQVKNGDRDSCSIYIALTDWSKAFEVNTKTSTFVDFTDESIIAYGELTKNEMSPESMSEYKHFTIDLKYRDLNRKPTYILIVCSSSKYGDYFVGGIGSTLLIDEFNLEFGEPVIDKDYIKSE